MTAIHCYKNKSFWLSLLVLLLALLFRVTTLDRTFIVNDEPLYWQWTNDFANALLQKDWRGTMIGIGYPSITVVWVHSLGLGIQAFFHWLAGASPSDLRQSVALDSPFTFSMLWMRRLNMGVANALVILLIYRRARLLLGETTALLGTGLMIFTPFVLADARTMRGDALMSGLMLLSVFDFLLFLKEQRRFRLICSGFTFGLALLTKMTALPVAGFVGIATIVYTFRQPTMRLTDRLRKIILIPATWGAVAALTFGLLWPAIWVAPVEVYRFMRNYAADAIDGRLNFFWGQLTHGEPLPLFYPVAFLFRANPLIIVGVIIITGLVLAGGWQIFREKTIPDFTNLWHMSDTARWSLLALGVYALIYGLVMNAGALKRDRYLMPAFPAAMFIAAAGLLWLVGRMKQRWPGHRLPGLLANGRWAWGLLSLALALELGSSLATHPYYYTYWNPLVGGGRVAMNMLMAEGGIDSVALVLLNQRPHAEQETVALLTGRDYAPAYRGRTVRLTNGSPWITADHIFIRQYHYQTQKMDPALVEYFTRRPPEYIVDFQGYIWAWVYPGPAAQYYAGSRLDGQAELLGYNLSSQTVAEDNPLHLKLFWQNDGFQPTNQIYVRLVDADGFIWAETTAVPLLDFDAVAYKQDAIVESGATVQIPPGTPPGLYFLKIGIKNNTSQSEVGQFVLPNDGDKIVIERPHRAQLPQLSQRLNQPVTPDITLVGAKFKSPLILTPHTAPEFTLYWQTNAVLTASYTVKLELIDTQGRSAAEWTGQPTHGLYPTTQWLPGEIIRDPWLLSLANANSPEPVTPDLYKLAVTLYTERQTSERKILEEVEVTDRLRLFSPPPIQHPLHVTLDNTNALLGYDLQQSPLPGGARFNLTLYWQALRSNQPDYTVFTQVLGPDGTVVGQHDSPPSAGTAPTTSWIKGEIVPDRHQIEFPTDASGNYRLIVGMYSSQTGVRLPVINEIGEPAGDYVELYRFTIPAGDSE